MIDSGNNQFYAVVPAAGIGSRVGAGQPKQYIKILGKTILEHTVSCLLDANVFTKIIIAVSPDDTNWQNLNVLTHPNIVVVTGGKERSDSVLAALTHIKLEPHDWVLVHDVARPCLKVDSIHHLINSLKDDEVGGILALPLSDTVKRVVNDRNIHETVDRNSLWGAQTPQMFPYHLLRKGLEQGLEQNLAITDEASAIELLGLQPKVIEGLASNIKVTRPSDIALAEFYLRETNDLSNDENTSSERQQ